MQRNTIKWKNDENGKRAFREHRSVDACTFRYHLIDMREPHSHAIYTTAAYSHRHTQAPILRTKQIHIFFHSFSLFRPTKIFSQKIQIILIIFFRRSFAADVLFSTFDFVCLLFLVVFSVDVLLGLIGLCATKNKPERKEIKLCTKIGVRNCIELRKK